MSNSPEKEQIIAQRYRILGILGEGGTGTTYQAQDLETSQEVALKALSLQRMNDWKVMELFEREARVLAQLNHPGIPKYLDYFHVDTPQDRSFYIAQQLAPGASLATLVQNGWRANEEEVRRIGISILEILLYLHELTPPVIHRDIKPQNIIRNSDGQIFLVDFGAVQDTYHSTFMRGSTVVGTYGYMAPEQFRGQAVPTTDLYGLGATLLFLLTHRSPADLPTDRLKIDFRSRIQVSEEFADWLEKMLEPDVEDRFLSAKEALLVLRGKRMIRGKSKSSVPWKAIVGVGVGVVIFMSVVTSYKYALINALGFFPISVYLAVKRGDIDTVINYLNQGGNINVKDRQGDTLLHITVKYRTSYSYSKPSDDGTGSHPLVFFDYDDDYVLHVGKFVKYCRKDCAKLLIAKGADINAEDNQSHTPLYWAIKDSDRQMVELFIANGGQVNTKDVNATGDNPDADGFTLLNWAADNNRKDVAEWLIAKGADVNISYQGDNSSCSTPLFFAVRRNSIDVAKLLLAKGAQVNFSCKHYSPYFGDSKTPLSLAVKRGDTEMVELLKSYGAKE